MREGVRAEVGHIAPLDGLRGIAVLWVMAFHFTSLRDGMADPWVEALRKVPALDALVRNGYLGVDLFFLISGFLLALPWLAHARAGLPPPSATAFYERRARRIVPAYYVQLALLFTLVMPLLHGITYWRSDLYVYLWNGVAHGLFLQDTTPLTSGSLGVNGALWTLPVEAQFYLLLPLAAPLLARAPRTGLAAALALSLAWQWAAAHDLRPLVGAELRLGAHWDWSEATVRQLLAMQLPGFLAHFAAGIALGAAWLARRDAPPARWIPIVGVTAGALLAASLAGWLPTPPEHARMVPSLALAVLLFCAASARGSLAAAILGRGPLAFAGRVSYSAYLWHLPIIAVWSLHPALFAGWLSLPGFAALVLGVAWMSWRWVEQPFLRPRRAGGGRRAKDAPALSEEPASASSGSASPP